MKLIKTLGMLLFSIILQTLLVPFRLTSCLFKLIEILGKVIKKTINFLIKQIESEVFVNQKFKDNGEKNNRKEGIVKDIGR